MLNVRVKKSLNLMDAINSRLKVYKGLWRAGSCLSYIVQWSEHWWLRPVAPGFHNCERINLGIHLLNRFRDNWTQYFNWCYPYVRCILMMKLKFMDMQKEDQI